MDETQWLLALCMFAGAALYTSVGHAGASAYIALMALFAMPPAAMRPTALTLNILVAAFTSFRYARVGAFRWRTLWPFLAGALPMAFLGGSIELPGQLYRPLVGIILGIAAVRLLWPSTSKSPASWCDPPILAAVAAGAAIGLLSGLTGTGGGIFLSPLLLFLGWSEPRSASGVAAVFILCNSVAGLLGNVTTLGALPPNLPLYAGAVIAGAAVGTSLGIRLQLAGIQKALGLVLIIAALKLVGVY